MKLKRTIVSILTALCLCAGTGTTAYAKAISPIEGGEIMPMYEIANNLTVSLSISSSAATCKSEAQGSSATSIAVTHTLQKYNSGTKCWENVKGATWSKSVNSNNIRLTSTKSGLPSGKYRLESVFTLTNASGKTETVTLHSSEKSC